MQFYQEGLISCSDSKNFFSNHSNLEQFKSSCFHEVLCVELGGFVWCFTQNVLEKNQIVTAHDSVLAWRAECELTSLSD